MAAAWTAIGLLATTLAALTTALLHLGSRIDAFGRVMGGRIDAQTARIDAHLEWHTQ